ncbi:MAG TPA: hypothetical protein DIU39_06780 [Flavobacteriales bacterium]|nr:hypothetical protein [Flavobacteriales bacterium]
MKCKVNFNYSYFLISWLIFSAGFSFSQEIKTISPTPKIQKHKKVDEGEKLIFKYKAVNPSNDTLIVLPPEVDCSCTSVDYPDFILPQQEIELVISFDTDKKWGIQERKVEIKAETKDKKTIYHIPLKFKVNVKATPETKALIKKQIKESKK